MPALRGWPLLLVDSMTWETQVDIMFFIKLIKLSGSRPNWGFNSPKSFSQVRDTSLDLNAPLSGRKHQSMLITVHGKVTASLLLAIIICQHSMSTLMLVLIDGWQDNNGEMNVACHYFSCWWTSWKCNKNCVVVLKLPSYSFSFHSVWNCCQIDCWLMYQLKEFPLETQTYPAIRLVVVVSSTYT